MHPSIYLYICIFTLIDGRSRESAGGRREEAADVPSRLWSVYISKVNEIFINKRGENGGDALWQARFNDLPLSTLWSGIIRDDVYNVSWCCRNSWMWTRGTYVCWYVRHGNVGGPSHRVKTLNRKRWRKTPSFQVSLRMRQELCRC